MINVKNQAAAVSKFGGVLVGEVGGQPACIRYVGEVGEPKNSDESIALFTRAAMKLGFKRDRRCKSGFRKV